MGNVDKYLTEASVHIQLEETLWHDKEGAEHIDFLKMSMAYSLLAIAESLAASTFGHDLEGL